VLRSNRSVRALVLILLLAGPLAARDPETADQILARLESKAFAFFRDHRHPKTGQVRDRARNFLDRGRPEKAMSSIAATGFYLSVLPDAVRRKWLSRDQAVREAETILRFAETCPHHNGLFYHFFHWETGERWRQSEVSTLDSAIFLNGAMVVSQAFPETRAIANGLLERANWPAFVTEKDGKKLLSLGWTPEKGLLGPIDVRTSEFAMPLFLAIGAKRPVPVECWYNTKIAYCDIAGQRVLHGELPLFVSQYGLCWADLTGRTDRDGIDFDAAARQAALANRAFCRGDGAKQFSTYHADQGRWWGLSSGDAARGYVACGPIARDVDGTVWPTAALASLPWASREISADLAAWQTSPWWSRIEGRYGLSPFNAETNWIAPDVIGIDLGAFLLSAANHRNRTVWDLWMKHPVAQSALERLKLTKPAAPEKRSHCTGSSHPNAALKTTPENRSKSAPPAAAPAARASSARSPAAKYAAIASIPPFLASGRRSGEFSCREASHGFATPATTLPDERAAAKTDLVH
jgi:hypothetical protein